MWDCRSEHYQSLLPLSYQLTNVLILKLEKQFSASDSFATMALYKFTYLLTYLRTKTSFKWALPLSSLVKRILHERYEKRCSYVTLPSASYASLETAWDSSRDLCNTHASTTDNDNRNHKRLKIYRFNSINQTRVASIYELWQAHNTVIRCRSGGSGVFILGSHWGGDTFIWGHTTSTFVLNYRVCNRLYQIINT